MDMSKDHLPLMESSRELSVGIERYCAASVNDKLNAALNKDGAQLVLNADNSIHATNEIDEVATLVVKDVDQAELSFERTPTTSGQQAALQQLVHQQGADQRKCQKVLTVPDVQGVSVPMPVTGALISLSSRPPLDAVNGSVPARAAKKTRREVFEEDKENVAGQAQQQQVCTADSAGRQAQILSPSRPQAAVNLVREDSRNRVAKKPAVKRKILCNHPLTGRPLYDFQPMYLG